MMFHTSGGAITIHNDQDRLPNVISSKAGVRRAVACPKLRRNQIFVSNVSKQELSNRTSSSKAVKL
jgi:hypothetical protein